MKDYFVYLPVPPGRSPWGLTAVSAGFTRVPPGSAYPLYRHPVDHHFSWAEGRVLNTWTLVFIAEGGGVFESAARARKLRVEAGSVFILFPNVWHRYVPDPATGWVEHWIECRGPILDSLRKARLFTPERPVYRTGVVPELLQTFERCHACAQNLSPDAPPILATLALHLLAWLGQFSARRPGPPRHIEAIIHQARLRMLEQCHQPLRVEKLARELGVGYSHFRQAFRQVAGMSPKQYHLQLRLQKAEDFLLNTGKSIKEISEILGFDSPYHLSAQFKVHTGLPPLVWRERRARRVRR
jgi:AraC-like DNA-binding protein